MNFLHFADRPIVFRILLSLGTLTVLLARWIAYQTPLAPLHAVVARTIGILCLVSGIALWARHRGHTSWWGLLGAAGILGVLFASFLPDRHLHRR
jgi:uncharacterized YccA/Bax inhibitor family protein